MNQYIPFIYFCGKYDHKTTLLKSSEYNMFCSDEEIINVQAQYLFSAIFTGNKEPWSSLYDKYICFNPSKIIEINYSPGAHSIYFIIRV